MTLNTLYSIPKKLVSYFKRQNLKSKRTILKLAIISIFFAIVLLVNSVSYWYGSNTNSSNTIFHRSLQSTQTPTSYCVHHFHSTPKDQQCDFVKRYCQDLDEGGLIQYIQLYSCSMKDIPVIASVLLVIWLLLILVVIGTASDEFLSPIMEHLSSSLKISHTLAGVTFLSVGNGAADISSSFAAFQAGVPGVSFGALLGAGIFVSSVVVGAIAWTVSYRVTRRPFLRDSLFYALSVAMMLYFVADGRIYLSESIGFFILYFFYVLIVIVGRFIYQRRKQTLLSQSILGVTGNLVTEPLLINSKPEQQELIPSLVSESDWSHIIRSPQGILAIQHGAEHDPDFFATAHDVRRANRTISHFHHENPRAPRCRAQSLSQHHPSQHDPTSPYYTVPAPSLSLPSSPRLEQNSSISPLDISRESQAYGTSSCISPTSIPTSDLIGFGILDSAVPVNTNFNHRFYHDWALYKNFCHWTGWLELSSTEKFLFLFQSILLLLLKLTIPMLPDLDGPPLDYSQGFWYNFNWHKFFRFFQPMFAPIVIILALNYQNLFFLGIPINLWSILIGFFLSVFLFLAEFYRNNSINFESMYLAYIDPANSNPPSDSFDSNEITNYSVDLGASEHVSKSEQSSLSSISLTSVYKSCSESLNGSSGTLSADPSNSTEDVHYTLWSVFCLVMGFLASIAWILLLANEIVSLLRTFGLLLNISPSLLGMTVLAWANSLSDLVADITIAKNGSPLMGLAACYASPLLNILLGIGLGATSVLLQTGHSYLSLELIQSELFLNGSFLLLGIFIAIVYVVTHSWKFDSRVGKILVLNYSLFLIISIILTFTVPSFHSVDDD